MMFDVQRTLSIASASISAFACIVETISDCCVRSLRSYFSLVSRIIVALVQ